MQHNVHCQSNKHSAATAGSAAGSAASIAAAAAIPSKSPTSTAARIPPSRNSHAMVQYHECRPRHDPRDKHFHRFSRRSHGRAHPHSVESIDRRSRPQDHSHILGTSGYLAWVQYRCSVRLDSRHHGLGKTQASQPPSATTTGKLSPARHSLLHTTTTTSNTRRSLSTLSHRAITSQHPIPNTPMRLP